MKKKIKIGLPLLILNVPYGSIHDHSSLFHQLLKKLAVVGSYFGSWGHALVAVAVVERFK